jgi:hypothetical protein
MKQLVCTECGERLPAGSHPTRKTCPPDPARGKNCPEKRKSRLKTARRQAARKRSQGNGGVDYRDEPMHQAALPNGSGVSSAIDEVGHIVIAEELRPLIREALTDHVLLSLRQLVGITPDIVARLSEDVNDTDPVVRQKAYGLVLRYVLGHGAVQPKPDEASGNLHIHFDSMPRPDGFDGGIEDDPEAQDDVEAVEVPDGHRLCEDCLEPKPLEQFDEAAPRCDECVGRYRDEVLERFNSPAED